MRRTTEGVVSSILLTAVALEGLSIGAQDAICARVEIQLSQTAMVTRTTFAATLSVGNDTDDLLEDVLVEIEILGLGGEPANGVFEIAAPVLTNIPDVDGTGDIAPHTTATAQWLIIPEDIATPGADPVKFTVGGRVRHKQEGIVVEIPLYPVEIEVYPDAELFLDYYLQRIVYSDNPFTTRVERAEPFSLGLIVRNTGFGEATNLRITSSQPEITDNDRQLLIAFQIIGAQLGTSAIDPCLTVNFGDVAPASSQVARWLMTSTLQGRFICMDAEFEHVTGLGNPNLSLIKDVDIHALVHMVELAGPAVPKEQAYLDDGLPDFLVDESAQTGDENNCDFPVDGWDDLPDVAHSSDSAILVVESDGTGSAQAAPSLLNQSVSGTVQINTPGWNYVRFPNLAHKRYKLSQIVRNGNGGPRVSMEVGRPGDVVNAWTTFRWLPFDGPPTSQEKLIHLFDYFETPGTYDLTLEYELRSVRPLDGEPKVLSLGAGGSQELELDAGLANAGKRYVLVGSMTEAGPGLRIGAAELPLRRDPYAELLLRSTSSPLIRNQRGVLDAEGRARVDVVIPPGFEGLPPGSTLYHAFVVEGGARPFASNTVALELRP